MINSILKNNHFQLQEIWPICELFSSKENYYTSMEKIQVSPILYGGITQNCFCFECHDKYTGVLPWQLYPMTNEAVYTVKRTTVFRPSIV